MGTSKIFNIVVISHALVIPVTQNRWKLLARQPGISVHVFVPEYWEQTWFGEKVVYEPVETHDNNFHVHPTPTTSKSNWGKYFFKSFDLKLRELKPDLIYIIQEESILIHHQIYLYRNFFAPEAKIIFLSMNASGIPYQKATNPIKRMVHKLLWNNIKKNTDVALVHYPGCVESLRSGSYNKPIYIQTQVGVDETLFAPDPSKRELYRKKTGFQNELVIGYVGRLIVDKGVDDLLDVFVKLVKKYPHIRLLLVGNGELRTKINQISTDNNLTDYIHITGFVDQAEVPAFMNAMDILVLASKTMPHWIDTFPLVTVQAQAVRVPVIASDSGAIPWQLADSARVFPEGDRQKLAEALVEFIESREERDRYAQKGQKRSHSFFCHQGMTHNFIKIIDQVMSGNYIYHDKNDDYTQWKAY